MQASVISIGELANAGATNPSISIVCTCSAVFPQSSSTVQVLVRVPPSQSSASPDSTPETLPFGIQLSV